MKKKQAEIASPALTHMPMPPMESAFSEVVALIEASRIHAAQAVNTVLIDL